MTTKVNDDTSVLDALSGGNTASSNDGIKLPHLTINIASEDSEGNEIPVKTFHLSGTDYYSKSVRFRPLGFYNKLIAMKLEGNKWKTTNETILYQQREQPIDARGGVACGRLMGKSVPESWTPEQVQANKKKANYYGFLFGLVEFPGKGSVLCDLRVPGGKAMQISNLLTDLEKTQQAKYRNFMINMKLATNPKDKSSAHPVLELSPDLSVKLPDTGLRDHGDAIAAYILAHNTRIKESFQAAKLARNSLNSDAEVVAGVDGFDDEIPY